MVRNFFSMLRSENGATLVEYALIVSLISIAAIAVVTTLSKKLNGTLSSAAAQLN